MSAKRKGSRNEHKTIRLLESLGYRCMKAGGSLGVFDIIAVSADAVLLIQVKSNRWPGRVEMEAIRLFPCPANAKKLVHRWNDRQRMPDVKEVESNEMSCM